MREIATSDIDEERRNQGKMSKEAKDRDVEAHVSVSQLRRKKDFFSSNREKFVSFLAPTMRLKYSLR